MSQLKANAKEFVFNTSASEWTPPISSNATIINDSSADNNTVESININDISLNESQEPINNNEPIDEEEPIDENDPLWKATLTLTKGDREAALKLLEDPDSLLQYPEIKAIMESTSSGDDDWETTAQPPEVIESVAAIPESVNNDVVVKVKQSSSAATLPDDSTEDDTALQDSDPRQHLNLVFIGHVDAGKSTLSGSILYIMGQVDARTIERYEREAKQRNRESWFLAFIMDTSEEERSKGITVEVGRAHFETETNRYTILDAPGHKNYVPNMIAGAAQADVGILVISARKGEFETGFEKGGQTREHAMLAKTLGVQHLVVVINKMDDPTVNWEQARYEECVGKLKPYLKQCGYVIKKDVKFLPLSGIAGDNVLREVSADKCPWWKNLYSTGAHNTTTPTLFSCLDSLVISGRNPNGPLRIPCLDRYFERGTVVLGKVESGTLKMDEEIVIAPTRKKAKVDAIYIKDTKVRSAKPGENVLIKFSTINVEDIQKGFVLCTPTSLCPAVKEIEVHLALIDLLEHRPIFSPGYEAVMHIHTVEIEVTCTALLYIIDKGRQIRRPFGRQGQQCVARLKLPLSTCLEPFDKMPALGRITLRDEGTTIAIGKVVRLVA
eukprot:CAMPEP_0196765464 /NCGR_PEP_ID=MMETSP1095-20130614/9015_1 /TAXON_ID=96789 ORGANISM="Chromulina nebulosa, Strain UTEXLB2642" /NCGR_SAMPLE_ID=MMETSP1095 /ASSEMBLY_ACC=CAM_ASM_000446 /LENGTH=611 /DNA_ID=CAMNT_0042123525 /DNA_START=16 /DNA_END=1848 /DNA_ORIENTATION=+